MESLDEFLYDINNGFARKDGGLSFDSIDIIVLLFVLYLIINLVYCWKRNFISMKFIGSKGYL